MGMGLGLGLGGSIGIGIGLVVNMLVASGGHVILFEKHPLQKSGKIA